MSPATRSSLIIGGLFGTFILLTVIGVGWKAREIRREQERTKALNSQTEGGDMVLLPMGKMTMGSTDGAPDEQPIRDVGSSRVDLQACKLEYSIVSPK